jgi:hypothetical protein
LFLSTAGEIENAQRALKRDAPSSGFVSRRSVIGQKNIGREFLGKRDGLPFPEVENGWENRQWAGQDGT